MLKQLADRGAHASKGRVPQYLSEVPREVSSDSSQLRLRVHTTRQDHRDKAGLRLSHGVKPMSQDQGLDQQCPWLGMGMTVAQLQGTSGRDKGERDRLKATLKRRSGDP